MRTLLLCWGLQLGLSLIVLAGSPETAHALQLLMVGQTISNSGTQDDLTVITARVNVLYVTILNPGTNSVDVYVDTTIVCPQLGGSKFPSRICTVAAQSGSTVHVVGTSYGVDYVVQVP
jgi:hypothetical protein